MSLAIFENWYHFHNSVSASSMSFVHRLQLWRDRFSDFVLEKSVWSFFRPFDRLEADNSPLANKMRDLEENYATAYKIYKIKPYLGRIVLFRAKETPPGYLLDPQLGWSKVAREVELYRIPGHHTSIMRLPKLAKKLDECIAKAL